MKKIYILIIYREYLPCLHSNESHSFLETYISSVEKRLTFSHFESSILPYAVTYWLKELLLRFSYISSSALTIVLLYYFYDFLVYLISSYMMLIFLYWVFNQKDKIWPAWLYFVSNSIFENKINDNLANPRTWCFVVWSQHSNCYSANGPF